MEMEKMEEGLLLPLFTGHELREEENNLPDSENKENVHVFLKDLTSTPPEEKAETAALVKNVLPVFVKDLATTTPTEKKALNQKAFVSFIYRSMLSIPPYYHGALLVLCGSYLILQAKTSTSHSYLQYGDSTKASSLLSLGKAFTMFFPEMAQITKFMLCYFLIFVLIWPPMHPGLQIFFMMLPGYYGSELLGQMASGIDVACSLFKLPLFWLIRLGGIGLSLICGMVTWYMVYFYWIFMHKGRE